MEPPVITIPVNTIIKFKKSELEALKTSQTPKNSLSYPLCRIFNARYFLTIYPNGSCKDDLGMAWIFLCIEKGNATSCIEADVKYIFESAKLSMNVKNVYNDSAGYGKRICETERFYDAKSKFFDGDDMVVTVNGFFKIELPFGIKYPFIARWTIKEAELEASKLSTNGVLKSKRFSISSESNDKYMLAIYPNGNKEKNRGKALLFLSFNNEAQTILEAICNITIASSKFSKNIQFACDGIDAHGVYICPTRTLLNRANRYIMNGVLDIKVAGTFICQPQKDESITVLTCAYGIETKTCQKYGARNFTVIVEGQNIEVHEHVLVEASPVFEAMLSSGMKEQLERKMNIPDFTFDVVQAAIQLMYSFSIDQKFSYEQIKSLLQFSDKYDIKLIKDLVQEYLASKLSPTNVCDLINFTSTTVHATQLHSKCSQYLIQCMKDSKIVYGLETLDKEFGFKMFKAAFTQTLQTEDNT